MSIRSRLDRIERSIDPNICRTCGNERGGNQVSREEAERDLADWLPHYGNDRASAIKALGEVDPECARALGYNAPYQHGHCQACGADLRTPAQRESDLRQEAEADLARYLPHFATREEAIECLREDDPETAAALATTPQTVAFLPM